MSETEVVINPATKSWAEVGGELAVVTGREPTARLLCTPCVMDIEHGSVCIIP